MKADPKCALVLFAFAAAAASSQEIQVIVGVRGDKAAIPYFTNSRSTSTAGELSAQSLREADGRFTPIRERSREGRVRLHVGGRDYWVDESALKLKKDSGAAGCLAANANQAGAWSRGANEGCARPERLRR